jgi:hypothetical protein
MFDEPPLHETLAVLAKNAEQTLPGAIAGFALVDPTGMFIKEAVFPSLPPTFQEAIAFIPLSVPYIGTCAQAICTGSTVSSFDIASDTRFDAGWRRLCLASGIHALKSKPLQEGNRVPVGTFVVGFKEPSSSERWDETLMTEVATLACEGIRQKRLVAGRLG